MNALRSLLFSFAVLALVPLGAQVVPAPKRLEVRPGQVVVTQMTCASPRFTTAVREARETFGRLGVSFGAPGQAIEVRVDEELGHEAYRIAASESGVRVTASTPTGLARATATLAQLADVREGALLLPFVTIEDQPDFAFRAFMVDMGRNPHSPAVLRQVVDTAWFYKVSHLHLHLSDDQLFSWPSRAFPKLYSERAGWTWDDFVELERYSQARGVTIVPEIDMPGHSTILRQRYPEVFGKTPTDLASSPVAQRGVETLLDEILSVFWATPYVHIGGDEAYGVPVEIQRDFINRLNKFVRSRGRRTVVWEGPRLGEGDNKVATDVLHMNWNTVNFPAQQMLDAGYDVVNAAWDPLYIVDHYPRTMFTAVDVERCYAWDVRRFGHVDHGFPTFEKPFVTEPSDKLIGFCMPWWEGREENLLGLCVPRLAAVAAAAWNRAGERDFASFQQRQVPQLKRLEAIGKFELPRMPFANPISQINNLAYRAKVTVSSGAVQPPFGPQRLTNGITDRFDHFLGYPTKPEPLQIVVDLGREVDASRIRVFETAVGQSHEIYRVAVSVDGVSYSEVGSSEKGTRGENVFVDHRFDKQAIRYVRVTTQGCHGLTFPSFSRLTEILVHDD